MCLFSRFSTSLSISCAGHLDVSLHQENFPGQTCFGYLCRWWCPVPPCPVSMGFPKRIPDTQCSPWPWILLLTGLTAPAVASTSPAQNSFLFYLGIKRGKRSLGGFPVISQSLFALGYELPAEAWWCFRDLLSCSCLNKIFTFAQISKRILSISYAALQKDFMEKSSYFFSGLSQFPSITPVASFLLCHLKPRTSTSC